MDDYQHWGEFSESINLVSEESLIDEIPKITPPSEFELSRFKPPKANSIFCIETSVNDDNFGNKSSNNKTSPFFETLKLIISKEFVDGTNEIEDMSNSQESVELNSISELMRQSVIMILTHAGFDHANSLTIDLLADVLEYYLKAFAKLLRNYTDSADLQSSKDFYDLIDKVLHHMNVPNFEVLRKFNDDLVAYYLRIKNDDDKNNFPLDYFYNKIGL